jgi:hypothetical protein
MSIVLVGLDAVLATFEAKVALGEIAAQAGKDFLGEEVLNEARSLVPVLTGTLRNSLTYEDGRVFTDVVYAGQVEFGGAHNPPEPYLRPAADTADTDSAAGAAKAAFEGV